MMRYRTSVLPSLLLLLGVLAIGPVFAAVPATDDGPATGSYSFGAPDRAQLSAARELPERLHATTVAGATRPAAAPLSPAVRAVAAPVDSDVPSAPLFLVHCVFLC